jgi:hypothetical protein
MNQQEFSDMFQVFCARDKSGALSWFTRKPSFPLEEKGDEAWIDYSVGGQTGWVPPSVQAKIAPWEDSLTCPKWIPKEGDPVALYNSDGKFFIVRTYRIHINGNSYNTEDYWENIAKYSGQLDLRVDTIRNEPHYKKDGVILWP